VLAFTDDDVEVTPTWLQNLTAPFDDGEWAGVAGRILPEPSFSPPRWIPHMDRYALGPLAVFDPAFEAGPLNESPVGANMAFRRRVFQTCGGFRTDLGPKPYSENPQKSEDSEFGHRLLMAGERIRYEPSAVVYHCVPADRIRKEYFLDWWFDKARADIRAHGAPTGSRLIIGGIPIGLFRRLAIWTVRWMFAVRPAHRFSLKLKVWINLGELKEYRRLSREAAAGNPRTGT
jgi:GT2 family glycosyltransferase